MKKILVLLMLFVFAGNAFAINVYDKNGHKTGSYRKTSSGYDIIDRNGHKTGSLRKDFSGRITEYDRNGHRVKTYRYP
ncbi:MAG: hypothetical protein E7Z90_03245 [Cyanobacteria bacterium SIG29]|nr:hypothetical protein [Cyanobacteria bacterium SIG29]